LTESRKKLSTWHQRLDATLADAGQVDPVALSVWALTLKPILDAAPGNPAVLLDAYRKHHTDPAARRLLEDYAVSLAMTMPEGERMQFEIHWSELQRDLASSRPEAERVVLAELSDAWPSFRATWATRRR
jgi:hypothetical protein